MAQQQNSIAMLKRRLIAEISRDKKKAVILGSLFVVAVFFVGKMLLKGSPEQVSAAHNPAGMATAVTPTLPGAGNTTARTLSTKSPKTKDAKGSVKVKKITRDIFMPNPSLFPKIEKKKTTTDVKGNVQVVETAQTKKDTELKQKKELIRKQGAELHLESMITGRVPIAIINGTVLGLDGAINGFRIVKIGSRDCVLEKDGFTVTLTME